MNRFFIKEVIGKICIWTSNTVHYFPYFVIVGNLPDSTLPPGFELALFPKRDYIVHIAAQPVVFFPVVGQLLVVHPAQGIVCPIEIVLSEHG